jgi:2-dehydropantoate 2-reductase
VDQVITDTAGNISSMLADVRAGRQTEHEAILGFLLEQEGQRNVAAPLLTSWLEALRERASQL